LRCIPRKTKLALKKPLSFGLLSVEKRMEEQSFLTSYFKITPDLIVPC
jgi:hypothetical protein